MNDKLSGIENNLHDRAVNLANKLKKTKPSFRFKGNQMQFELNTEISGNVPVRAILNSNWMTWPLIG
jgi:hypothetical protein